MRGFRAAVQITVLAGCLASATQSSAQVPATVRQFGAPVAPMFEGWYRNSDGTATILVGFFNPNKSQTVDLPVSNLNRFSPGTEDRGQPTHFPPGRSWGVLTLRVPGDFDGNLTWTLTANDQPATIPVHLEAPYFIEPFRDAADGNEPPTIRFAPSGEAHTGPPVGIAQRLTATVGTPLNIRVWTSDVKPEADFHEDATPGAQAPALRLRWHLHRGPSEVQFDESVQTYRDSADQDAATTVTFSSPGDYWLRAEALDETGAGGGGFQCCWTSAIVHVTVSQ